MLKENFVNVVESLVGIFVVRIVKKIKTRPDKLPANFEEIKEEFQINTYLFQKYFSEDIVNRGYKRSSR